MANKIYLEYNSYEDEAQFGSKSDLISPTSWYMIPNSNVLELPLLEDIKIDSSSKFTSWNEMLPKIGELINLATSATTGVTGTVDAGLLDLKNKFDLPKWQSTDPITVNVTLGFFTKTDPYYDVYLPVKQILGLSILSKDPNEESLYRVPGISLNTMKEYTLQSSSGGVGEITVDTLKAKLLAFEVPGVIYVPLAYVSQAFPTYSKQITESVIPLWCSLDCTFVSISPATTDAFNQAFYSGRGVALGAGFKAAKAASKLLG